VVVVSAELAQVEREVATAVIAHGAEALAEARAIIEPEDLATTDARLLFAAACRIVDGGHDVTVPGLVLAMKEAGSSHTLAKLLEMMQGRWGYRSALPEYLRRVRRAADVRRILEHCKGVELLALTGDPEPAELLAQMEAGAQDMRERGAEQSTSIGKDPLRRALMRAEDDPFMATDFGDLKIPRGGGRGFTGICGRPGMGKTAFVLGSIVAPARIRGQRVAVFSVEMSVEDCERRQLATVAGLQIQQVHMSLDHTDEHHMEIIAAADRLVGDCYMVDEHPAPTAAYIRSQVERYSGLWGGIDLVVIDHFGLVRHDGHPGDRLDQRMARSSAEFRRMQKETGSAVVVLSQLNRDLERRSDRRPQMADLRECGALEEDAGLWLGLYRPSVYDEASAEDDEVIVMKNRNGETKRYRCAFDGARMRWAAGE